MKGNFMETHSPLNYVEVLNQRIAEAEKHIEEHEKMIQELKKHESLLHCYNNNDKLVQEVKKMNQDTLEVLKKTTEMFEKDIEHNKTLIQFFDISNLASKLVSKSLSKFFLFSSLNLIDKDLVLKNSHYDMENDCFTGLIKNEKNNKVVYAIVNGNNRNPLYYLVELQDENEIPDYPKNEQNWIGVEDVISKLVYLLQ